MHIYDINDFPSVKCGTEPQRDIRLVISPYTTGEKRTSIVHVTVPPLGVSNAHTHNDCDEFIYFVNKGKVVIDEKEYEVKENSIVFVPKNSRHECVNTSKDEVLMLLCIFIPPFEPYGIYSELIEKTKHYLMEGE